MKFQEWHVGTLSQRKNLKRQKILRQKGKDLSVDPGGIKKFTIE